MNNNSLSKKNCLRNVDYVVHYVETKANSDCRSNFFFMLPNNNRNTFTVHTTIVRDTTPSSKVGEYQTSMKTEAVYPYDKFVQTHQTTRCQYPKDHNMNFHRRGNLKFHASRLSFATVSPVKTLGTKERSRVGSLPTVIQALLSSLIRCRPSQHPQHYFFLK